MNYERIAQLEKPFRNTTAKLAGSKYARPAASEQIMLHGK